MKKKTLLYILRNPPVKGTAADWGIDYSRWATQIRKAVRKERPRKGSATGGFKLPGMIAGEL